MLSLALLAGTIPARAADDTTFPPTLQFGGATLVRNGVGDRRVTLLRIHIYDAALYLTRRSHDPAEIIERMPDRVLVFHFFHDVDQARARASWTGDFERNCEKPCQVNPAAIENFLSRITAISSGDQTTLAVSGDTVTATQNGKSLGSGTDAGFAHLVLSTFFGAHPASEALKQGLLGNQ
jgi:hypothetical protein